jgi:hypothetical protein
MTVTSILREALFRLIPAGHMGLMGMSTLLPTKMYAITVTTRSDDLGCRRNIVTTATMEASFTIWDNLGLIKTARIFTGQLHWRIAVTATI